MRAHRPHPIAVIRFAERLVAWQRRHGRHDLPWQNTRDPYRIWVSEIMLQQTQVDTVVPYYARFMARFPDVAVLAAADLDEVLGLWSGLGYYARARNLHATARQVATAHGGHFPREVEALAALPGIGRSTAAAIAAFAFGARAAILDGNVRRVLCRAFGIEGPPGERAVEKRLWALAESLLPERAIAAYTQAQMDLGATLCTRHRPRCGDCPLAADCVAHREGRTAELPTPRPRRDAPRRSVRVALIRSGDRVLLERRPPAGIWGGLFALPEIPSSCDDARAWIAGRFGFDVRPSRELAPLEHAFTHFRLAIQPIGFDVDATALACHEPDHVWLELAGLDEAGLPAPVRRILESAAGGR